MIVTSLTSPRTLSRILFLAGGTALGLLLLIVLLHSVNLDQLANDFASVDVRYLALAIVPFLLNLLLKVPRWALLYGCDAPGWDTLFGAMNVGYAINALFPARLGELVRAYWIRDRAGVSMVRTLSTIALERVADGLSLLIILVVVAPTVAFPGELVGPTLTIGAVFVAALLGMSVLVYSSGRGNSRLATRLARLEASRFAVAARAFRQIMTGLQALRDRRSVALLALYSAVIWGSNIALAWLIMRAFHLDVSMAGAGLLVAVVNLGMVVPSSPGYVGIYEYLTVLTLGLYGVARTPALAAALAFHVIAFVPVTIIGLVYIARVGMETTLQMVRSSRNSPTEVEPSR